MLQYNLTHKSKSFFIYERHNEEYELWFDKDLKRDDFLEMEKEGKE